MWAWRRVRLTSWVTGCRAQTSSVAPSSWTCSTRRSTWWSEERQATVLVGGEAGIGKTRLVDEFCQRPGREALVAAGACVPVAGGGLPYGPVVGILEM